MSQPILIIGELFVDFTLAPVGTENKLRLGGIAHAARALWATKREYSVAAVGPTYLRDKARSYLREFDCVEFIELGEVHGAPNVMVIGDVIELGDQGYENLLRDEKTSTLNDVTRALSAYRECLIFPGAFDLKGVRTMLPQEARVHLDIAYDVKNVDALSNWKGAIETILISTSSELFLKTGSSGIVALSEALKPLSPKTIVLKENRGGARILSVDSGNTEQIPALLGPTQNSVGVGDAFSAAFVTFREEGNLAAGLKAARVSSAYAQTTFPDVFEKYVQRSFKLTVGQMNELGGTSLPWERRQNFPIYLAAPDFSYVDRREIDAAIASLEYHNFSVRRPVQENGELPKGADASVLAATFQNDVELLEACALVFAIPLQRDPGTLVEIGLAIDKSIPVVVYDPRTECNNTMVMGGASCYSSSMSECLNSVFTLLAEKDASQ